MNTAAQIYEQKIQQLPKAERLRLAVLILEDLTQEAQNENIFKKVFRKSKLSARQQLEPPHEETEFFKTSVEAGEHINAERQSWNKNDRKPSC